MLLHKHDHNERYFPKNVQIYGSTRVLWLREVRYLSIYFGLHVVFCVCSYQAVHYLTVESPVFLFMWIVIFCGTHMMCEGGLGGVLHEKMEQLHGCTFMDYV